MKVRNGFAFFALLLMAATHSGCIPIPPWKPAPPSPATTHGRDSDSSERTDPEDNAPPLLPPFNVRGGLKQSGSVRRSAFLAKEGVLLNFRCEPTRKKSPFEPVISIVSETGELLSKSSPDGQNSCALQWAAPASGRYFVCIEDQQYRGGPDFLFRLLVDIPAKSPLQPSFSGKIRLVDKTAGFVLIERTSPTDPASGTDLQSFRGGYPSATLRATPERRPPFITADILTGEPLDGDQVFEAAKVKKTAPGR